MAKRIGFAVFESAEDYEQGLRLLHGGALPRGGILDWRGERDAIAVFETRAAAHSAIARTEHYRLAFGNDKLPERKLCKVVPVGLAAQQGPTND